MLLLFPYGLLSAGSVHDEVGDNYAIKRVGSVDLGSLQWGYTSSLKRFVATVSDVFLSGAWAAQLICPIASSYGPVESASSLNWKMGFYQTGLYVHCDLYDSEIDPTDAFKTAMQGVMLYYELATPITVTFPSPKDLEYNVQSGGTEQLLPTNPTGTGPVTAPIIESVNYPLDAVGTLTNLPKNYISVESMDSFTTALGNTLNLNITKTWDSTNNKWTFSVTSRS